MATRSRRQPTSFTPPIPPHSLQVFGWERGYNDTEELSSIDNRQLGTGSQNIAITNDPSWRTRNGSTMHIGFLDALPTSPILGLISYVYGSTRRLIACADNGSDTKFYHDGGGSSAWTGLTEVLDSRTALVESTIRDDNSMLYVTNGVDSLITWDGTSEARVSTAQLLGRKLAYWLGRLVATKVTANPNRTNWSNEFAATFTSTSFFPTGAKDMQGNIVWQRKLYVWNDEEMWRIRDFTLSATGSNVAPTQVEKLGLGTSPVNQRACVIGSDGLMYWIDRKGQVWRYNDSLPENISSDTVQRTIDSINLSKLQTKGCMVAYKDQIRIAFPVASETENSTELVYDIKRGIWYPPQNGLTIGVYCVHPDANGTPELYYGDNTMPAVYKMDVDDTYTDEKSEEGYTDTATDTEVNANSATRAAQSFKLHNYTSNQSVSITKVAVLMKKNTGTTTNLQVRIETDLGGEPSGTAVTNATATLTAFSGTSYAWRQVAFATAPTLTGNTTYWLVVKHVTEATGDSKYHWSTDNSSPTYDEGNLSTYANSTSSNTTNFQPGATAVDGYTSRELLPDPPGESWATIRTSAGTGATSSSNTVGVITQANATTDTWQALRRGVVKFDTSSLPDDAVITAAYIDLYCWAKHDALGSQKVNLVSATTAADTSLVAADYAVANFGTTRFVDTDLTVLDLTANAYNRFTLNASGLSAISLTGVSSFGLRFASDIDNSSPTWVAIQTAYAYFESRNATNKPTLTVTYSSGGGTFFWTSVSGSDQGFKIYSKSQIDSRAVTKAFPLASEQLKDHLRRIYYDMDASGSWNAYLGYSTDDYATSYTEAPVSLASSSSCFGSGQWGTGNWGVGKWGGGGRASDFLDINTRARHVALRFRTLGPSEYFQLYGVTLNYRTIPNLVL